jgi:hypothetical protein
MTDKDVTTYFDTDTNWRSSRSTIAQYRMWCSHLYKWPAYIKNRRSKIKEIDSWSQYIVDNAVGDSAVYASGGLFFKDFLPDVTVIEHKISPINIPGMIYLNVENPPDFTNKFDNLIMLNPQPLKYHHSLWEFFSKPGVSRAGWKPSILNWLRPGAKIFLSESDWHLYYDRLKMTPQQYLEQQLADLESHGLECIYQEIGPSNYDIVNGNIKLVLRQVNV